MPTNIDTLTNREIIRILKSLTGIYDKNLNSYRLNLLQQMKASYEEVQGLLKKMFERYGPEVSYKDMTQYQRLKNLEAQIDIEIRKLDKRFKKSITSAIEDAFQTAYYRSGFAFESSLGIKMGFTLLNQKVIEAAILNPMDRIRWIDRATEHGKWLNQKIKSEITQALIQGNGYANTAAKLGRDETLLAAVKEYFGNTSGKLVRVVQTETHRAHTMGRLEADKRIRSAAEKIGFETEKTWLATLDGKTRDEHQRLDGQIADEKGLFEIDGYVAEGPGLFGVAAMDINCRCDAITTVKGFTLEMRKDNVSKGLVKFQNYEDWKAGRSGGG